jgi:hypothetical protein
MVKGCTAQNRKNRKKNSKEWVTNITREKFRSNILKSLFHKGQSGLISLENIGNGQVSNSKLLLYSFSYNPYNHCYEAKLATKVEGCSEIGILGYILSSEKDKGEGFFEEYINYSLNQEDYRYNELKRKIEKINEIN